MTEQWLPVVGYEGTYEISDMGSVRRTGKSARNGNGRGGGARIGRHLKQHTVNGGYLVVQLWQDGKPKTCLVHRLVAAAFLDSAPDSREVNHKDGNKRNNSLDNLEYVTHSENNTHAYRTGLRQAKTEHLAVYRRKPRRVVACECGCGTLFETPDRWGQDRRFVSGHNMKKAAA